MSRLKFAAMFGVLALSISLPVAAADLSDWAINEYIESNSTGLLSYSIISGDLKSNITREEFCELTINMYEKLTNEPLRVPTKSPFRDCDSVAVSKAYYNGIVKGVSENEFEPNRPVTRQEMAVMIVNTLNASEADIKFNVGDRDSSIERFTDYRRISDWAKPALTTLVNHSLLTGNSDNEIMPLDNTTREQAFSCINRCYKNFSELNQDRYMLPILLSPTSGKISGDIIVSWAEVESSQGYYIIVKDQNGKLVYTAEAEPDAYVDIIAENTLKKGNYSIVIGAKMPSGDTVFGLPVDFAIGAETATNIDKEASENLKAPIINYENEVLTEKAKKVFEEADKYLGIKYVYGGTTPDGFDCSGFVQYVFNKIGIKLKRVSRDQYAYNGTSVSKNELRPGDLVFFGTGGIVGHVGIYAGGGQMIHSSSTGKSICYTSINSDYYLSHYMGGKKGS